MTEQTLIKRLRDERPLPPAGFEARQENLLTDLMQKGEPKMKRKMSLGLALAIVLILLSVTAFAATLVFSPRADIARLADQALKEHYGITDEMQVFFTREVKEQENGAAVVTYTGNWDMKYVLGQYTVTLNGKDAQVRWSHDGEDTSGGLEAEAWGAEQLNEAMEMYKESHEMAGYYNKAAAIAARHPETSAPAPISEESHAASEADWEYWNAMQAALAEQSVLSLDELLEIARQASQTTYGLSGEQTKMLKHNPGMSLYCEQEGTLCYEACLVLIQQPSADPSVFPEYIPMDGEYCVLINTQTGRVENINFYAALAGNG